MLCAQKLITCSLGNCLVKSSQKYISLSSRLCSSNAEAKKTSLYEFHIKNGGKMVNFADHLLPVQYANMSVSESHQFTRNNASLFDVSHMLQTLVQGKDSIEWFETMCPVDLKGMVNGSSSLTVFMNNNGGILDDLIVTKVDENNLYVVSNAGRMEHDKQHMMEHSEIFKKRGKDVNINFLDVSEQSLIALQGPKAVETLQKVCTHDLSKLYFMNSVVATVGGVEGCRVTRCGYTGEDGVEISISAGQATGICERLIASPNVKLAGLGARDSLRLEAGLCLYGNDIDDTITPIEANLVWLIAKRRRAVSTFIGADIVFKQMKEGVTRRRVGVRLESGPPARKGAQVMSEGGQEVIGVVTSGCPSPSLGGSIAMAYVKEEYKKPTTKLVAKIRNSNVPCEVAKMPFLPAKYFVKK